jgi:uncharacterized protein (TIGR00369 family)
LSDAHADNPTPSMPTAAFFGFVFRERSEERAAVALPLRREFLQTEALVHGGILATLADTAAVYMLYGELDPRRTMTSIEFKLNFVRPAVLAGGEVEARAQLVRRGRTVALVDVEVVQRDALVAKGLFTYLFGDRAGSPNA